MKKQITIGVGEASTTAKEFIDAWNRAERGETAQEKHLLHFESLEALLKTLPAGRRALLKKLHANGPMSIRALANDLGRDYKNVHTDARRLEKVGLIERTEKDKITVPWDIVEARLLLAA
jgi:predicted transcriptional regulator